MYCSLLSNVRNNVVNEVSLTVAQLLKSNDNNDDTNFIQEWNVTSRGKIPLLIGDT